MPPNQPATAQQTLQRISDELARLAAVIDGSPRYNTAGVLPTINYLRDEVLKLRSAVRFLWIICGLLFVMTFFTMLAVIYLVQAHL